MIRKLSFIFIVALALTTLTGCRKLALHGDFSGMWQILTIDYPDGTKSIAYGQYYYSFNRDVAQLSNDSEPQTRIHAHLAIDADGNFALSFPYTEFYQVAPWGILPPSKEMDRQKAYEFFTVNELTSKRLVMTTSQGVVITCRKY